MKFDNWIFVTGAPRSCTTFVGRILSTPLNVDYIYEPTNPFFGMPGIEHRYLYLRPQTGDENELAKLLAPIFTYDLTYRAPDFKPGDRWFTKFRKLVVGSRQSFDFWRAKLNPLHNCAVLKDPIACLLTEYLYTRYRVRPVICVRHPIAFVASYLDPLLHSPLWHLPDLTAQPELLEDYFSGDAKIFDVDRKDRVAGAAILWWALNRVLFEQCARHPDWIVVVHEELCKSPLATFRSLYSQLGLRWSARVERVIRQQTGAHNRVDAGSIHDHCRNSVALFEWRRGLLSKEDRHKIYRVTRDIALSIYSEESFGLGEDARETVDSPVGGVRRLDEKESGCGAKAGEAVQ
jgi:hypothetical protein